MCGAKDHTALEHHHVKPKVLGGTDEEKNLLTLCGECHGEFHDYLRPMRLGLLIQAGKEKAQERSADEWQEIAHQSAQRAERAAEASREAELIEAERVRRLQFAADRAALVTTRCQAPDCNNTVTQPRSGRPKRFCKDACRVAAHRQNGVPKETEADELATKLPNLPIEIIEEKEAVSLQEPRTDVIPPPPSPEVTERHLTAPATFVTETPKARTVRPSRHPKAIPDAIYPGMWRVQWPDGRLSDMANLSRINDAISYFTKGGY
jgi:hypothetical protein